MIVETLGGLFVGNYIHIFCRTDGCKHHGRLDIPVLVARHGLDASLDAVRRSLFCPVCRAAGRFDRNLQWIQGHDGNLDMRTLREVANGRPIGNAF